MAVKDDAQMSMDEKVIEHPKLEAAIMNALRLRDEISPLNKAKKEAQETIKTISAEFGVGVYRIGRYVMTVKDTEAADVEFRREAGQTVTYKSVDG